MTPGATASPNQPAPVRIPSPDDPELLAQRRRRMQEEFARRDGYAANTLAPDAAGAAYNRTTLG